jgi:hypothetical protein
MLKPFSTKRVLNLNEDVIRKMGGRHRAHGPCWEYLAI